MIACKNPKFIFHPHSRVLCDRYRTIVTPQGILHTNKCPYVKLKDLTEDEASLYNVLNPATGELFPMFLQVACNHCILCANKKTNEWAYRCICETRANGLPYFVTLTYNEESRPQQGVMKEDVQKFIKRLRTNLDRCFGSNDLRYICLSEYTHSKTRRPHYHLLIWNIPDEIARTAYHRLKWIEQHWTQPTGRYKKDGSPEMSSNGFCYVLPCLKGGVNYVLKYMYKSDNVPDDQNPNFRLSSIGLGRDHINNHLSNYSNPNILNENVYDIIRQKSVSRPFTCYTKNKLYPSESKCMTPFFNTYIKKCISAYNIAFEMTKCLPPELHYLHIKFPDDVRKVFRKLRPLHIYSRYYIDETDYAFIKLRGFRASEQCTSHRLANIKDVLDYAYQMFKNAMCDYDEKRIDQYVRSLPRYKMHAAMQSIKYDEYQPNIDLMSHRAEKILNDYIRKEKF